MKSLRRIVLILIAGIAAGYLLMVAAYALPLDWTGKTYEETVSMLRKEKMYPNERYSRRRLDNFSDALIMLIASYKGDEGPWLQAAANYFISYGGDDFYHLKTYPYDWLVGNYDHQTAEPVRIEYGRYWHGYVIPVRLLLRFFNYSQIRSINSFILLFLMSLTLMALRRRLPRMVLPFALMFLFLAPSAVGRCLEFSGDIYTMLIAALVLLRCSERQLVGRRIRYYFLIVGMVTPFAGFFTSPTLTLTVPLVLMCQIRRGEKKMLRLVSECVLFWGIGYVGMWGGKWAIAVLLEKREFLTPLLSALELRSSRGGTNRAAGLVRCFRELLRNKYLDVLLLSFAVLTIAESAAGNRKTLPKEASRNLLYLIPAVLVCAWYLFFSNHVFVHYWFTYRHACILIPSLFAALDFSDKAADNTTTEA